MAAATLAQKQKPGAPQTAGPCQLLVSQPERGCLSSGERARKAMERSRAGGPGQTWPLAAKTRALPPPAGPVVDVPSRAGLSLPHPCTNAAQNCLAPGSSR